jgi:UDP-N-acetylmuramoyl-L-alanyl-D-glutamate--2,6-diaminopimelate ligase
MAALPAAGDRLVTGLVNDSRQVAKGDLFLATQGLRRHGLEFLPSVRRAGAAAVAWEPPFRGRIPDYDDPPLLAVEDLSQKLGVIAGRFYREPSRYLKLVGITGTDGKTSCAHFIAQALSTENNGCGILGTLGYGRYGALSAASHTTPDAVTLQRWLATLRDQGATHVAMEVSSHALAQKRVAGLDFTVAVLTNFTRDHLDYHGGLEAYADAKRRLFLAHDPQLAVLNMDDALGRELTERVAGAKVGYGLGARDAGKLDGFVWGENLVLCESGQQLQVLSSWGRGVLRTGLLGRFNASNLLAALAVLLALDIPFGEALRRLRRVSNVPGRMERFGADPGRPLAIVDYAHTPEALEQALRTLKEHGRGKLWCVFGCGGDRDPGKRPLMGRAAECVADRIIVTDDNPRTEDPERIIQDILAGMENPEQAWVSRDRRQAIATALREAAPEDLVLIAGKGHEDYQLIGDARIPFSDREIVRNCLEAIA